MTDKESGTGTFYMTDKESGTGKFYTNYSFEYPEENVRVATSSFEDVPSNKTALINLTMNGILRPSEKLHVINMKFKGDNIPQKDVCAQSYGTFVLCKDVYNSRKIIKTSWNKETSTLEVIIDLKRCKVRPKGPTQFSFTIQINDTCVFVPPGCKMTLTSPFKTQYRGTCGCSKNLTEKVYVSNTWNKTAFCSKNCVFSQKGSFLGAVTNCDLPAGYWFKTCQIRRKFILLTVNGEEKKNIQIQCAVNPVGKNDCGGGWKDRKLNTLPTTSFYQFGKQWKNVNGILESYST